MSCCFYCFKSHDQYNSYCSKYLNQLINYYNNIDLIPVTIKINNEYTCADCKRCLKNKQNYNYHIKNQVCKKVKEHKCSCCEKIFSSKQMLNYHILNNVCGLIEQTEYEEQNDYELVEESISNTIVSKSVKLNDFEEINLNYEQVFKQIAAEEFRNYIRERIAKEYDNKSLDEIKKETPFKKQKISNIFKRQCWNHWVGEHVGKIICPCCKLTEISQLNFSCGHIISESKGGKLIVENVRPICSNCNSSVYVDNLTDYI